MVENGHGRAWPAGEVVIAAVTRPAGKYYVLAIPQAALRGEALTAFLAQVAPFGCPVPGSLIRAYSLPDAPFPSILLKEHEVAPDGIADAYRRFLAVARRPWIAALDQTGPGLCPVLAWEAGTTRRLVGPRNWPGWRRSGSHADGRCRWLSRPRLAAARPSRARGGLADTDVARRPHQDPKDHRPRVPGLGRPPGPPAIASEQSGPDKGRESALARPQLSSVP